MGTGKTYSTDYLVDSNGNTGVAGQILVTTATGVNWQDAENTGDNQTQGSLFDSKVVLIDTPNGGLKPYRVITDEYGEWIQVGRFAANAMTTIQGTWSSVSGLSTGIMQAEPTSFSADFGDSFPDEVRVMGATDFNNWRNTRTIDWVYKVPEGRKWKFFFSGGATNGMEFSTKYGWGVNGAYDGFGRWVNPAQTFVRMSDNNVTNPSAAYTTATVDAFNWNGASDAKITVSSFRAYSGQDTTVTSGFGNDDNIQGFFDVYPGETSNMGGGTDFSSAVWVLIKLPGGASGNGGGGYWAANGNDIYNTNSANVGIGTSSPGSILDIVDTSATATKLTIGTGGEVPVISAGGGNTDLRIQAVGSGGFLDLNTGSTSTTRMRIDADGYVGINKTTSLGSHGLSILKDASNQQLGCYYNETNFAAFGARSNGDVQIYGSNASGLANILLGVDGSAVGGNVGIGVTAPGALLQVGDAPTSSSQQGARIYGYDGALSLYTTRSESNFNTALYLYNDPTGSAVGTGTGIMFRANSDTTFGQQQATVYSSWTTDTHASRTAKLVFQTCDSGALSDKMTILGNGNTGIGVTSPGEKLVVAGNVFISGGGYLTWDGKGSYVTTVPGNAAGFIFSSSRNPNDGSGAFPFNNYGEMIFQGNPRSGYNGGFTWVTGQAAYAATVTPTPKMRLTTAGDLGIGTTSPDSTLTLGNATDNVAELRVLRSNALSTNYAFINTVGGTAQIGGSADTRILSVAATASLLFNTNGVDRLRLVYDGQFWLKLNATTSGYEGAISNDNDKLRIFGSRFGGTGKYVSIWSDGANENARFYPTNTVFYKNVGLGDTAPASLSANTTSISLNSSRADLSGGIFSKANGTIVHQMYWDTSGFRFDLSPSSGDFQFKVGNTEKVRISKEGNISTPVQDLSSTAVPTSLGLYTTEIRLIDTPNGGLKQCRVITDNYGEWILVGRFAASAMTTVQSTWSSESGLDTSTSQSTTTKFSADFGDSYPTEVRIMGATDFGKWRDTRTVDFVYGVPEGTSWKYFFSGGAVNGMTSVGPNHSGNNKFGWSINGSYDGFGRWVNPLQTSVGMSDGNPTNPSAAYTTATTNAFNWDTADDAKITVSATRTFSGQDSFETAGFGNDDGIQGFFDEYPSETNNMQGGVDFSSSAWVLIKLPTAISSGSGGGVGNQWTGGPANIHSTNTAYAGIGTSNPRSKLEIYRPAGQSSYPQLTISTGEANSRDWAVGTDVMGAGDLCILQGASVGAAPQSTSANVRMRFTDTTGSKIMFKYDNTTELGTYASTDYGGSIKRIRMRQGGEIHFGDTAVSSPLGITEGTWDNFTDQDYMSIYARSKLDVYTANVLMLTVDTPGSHFNTTLGIGASPTYPLDVQQATTSGVIIRAKGIGAMILIESNTAGEAYLYQKPNITSDKEARFMMTAGTAYGWAWSDDGSGTPASRVKYMKLDQNPGTLTVKGDVIAYGTPSDISLKENIKPIDSALDKVMKLQGVTFDWKKTDSILELKEDIGFIAQDVQKVVPELIRENSNGLLSMRHQGVAPILLEAIKELKAEIDLLKSKPCNCNKCNCNI